MRDDKKGPPISGKILFQPRQGINVKMIRRLVEQEQVGLACEQFGKGQARVLPARQRADRALRLREPHFGEERTRSGTVCPPPEVVVARVERVQRPRDPRRLFSVSHGKRLFRARDLPLERRQFRESGEDIIGERHVAEIGEVGILREHSDRGRARKKHLPRGRRIFARDTAEERGFAHSVDPNDADPVPLRDRESQPPEDFIRPERKSEVGYRTYNHGCLFLIVEPTVTVSVKIRVRHLTAELLTNTFVFREPPDAARAVPPFCFEPGADLGDHLRIRVQADHRSPSVTSQSSSSDR